MAKKPIIAAAAVIVLAIVAYRVYLALLPDETRIRRLVASMAGAFNDGAAGALTSWLADDFQEGQSHAGKNETRLYLMGFFHNERDPKTGEQRYLVEAPREDVEVRIDPGDSTAADLAVKTRFLLRRANDEPAPVATVLFTARLAKVDGSWRIRRADQRILEGRRPF